MPLFPIGKAWSQYSEGTRGGGTQWVSPLA
jgi:hypothetical protein